ncbi:hypothetical protein AAJ76_5000135790 [Vairimorpha ceranae]|uniref:Uncharacterized protein n=1 Tax=Vairimorpha ceranae TaxID=40302 RepID=A0A0F9WI87_9MICR|nr:hypothetical protein AAJ76_5000135790 [Vairimorpha ceranae]KKO76295.1 hypothetical protein AAJ76_5000135790 [Vairimorpha ceranae]
MTSLLYPVFNGLKYNVCFFFLMVKCAFMRILIIFNYKVAFFIIN